MQGARENKIEMNQIYCRRMQVEKKNENKGGSIFLFLVFWANLIGNLAYDFGKAIKTHFGFYFVPYF